MTPDEATRQTVIQALLATYTYAGQPGKALILADAILATEPGSRLTTTDHPDVRAARDALVEAAEALRSQSHVITDREARFWPDGRVASALLAAVDAYLAALSATSESKRQPECWCGADGIDRDHEGARFDIVCPRHDP
jgi:hypothetical protein